MRRHLVILALFVASCGADLEVGGTSPTTPPATTTTTNSDPKPSITNNTEARAQWAALRPAAYSFTYTLLCECDAGPWQLDVGADGFSTARHLGIQIVDDPPYWSIDDVFDEIDRLGADDQFPIKVRYDATWGYPIEFIFNEPELPSDGGFILRIESFEPKPDNNISVDPDVAIQLADAKRKWSEAAVTSYDYSFSRVCFCPREFIGPYEVAVRAGAIVRATLAGTDILDVELLGINSYDDLIETIDGVFAEIERGIDEAHSLRATYHPDLGYPVDVYIDWDERMADEETGYSISNLTLPEG